MLRWDIEDNWVWIREGNEKYSVRSSYNRIRNEMRADEDKLFYKLWQARHCVQRNFMHRGSCWTSYQ